MTKKIISFIVSVVMIFICIPVISFADFETGTYRVTNSAGVKIYADGVSTADVISNARKDVCLSVLKIENGYGYVVYDSIYGWIDLTAGLDYVRSDPYTDSQGKVEGLVDIKITKEPEKVSYIDGEESADITGLEVSGVFSDGTVYPVSGYSVAFPSLTKPGKKVVTVYYAGFTASFFVTVERVPVTGIEITSKPIKTEYKVGQEISFDGLEVTAHFNGRADKIITDYEMSEIVTDGTAEAGVYTVTLKYKYDDITASFCVTVENTSLQSLKIKTMPENLEIYQGEELDLSGVVLTAEYDNGVTKDITDFEAEYDNDTAGTNTAKLYYDGKYVAFDFTVKEKTETGIEIIPPKNAKSVVGKKIDLSDLQVYIVYNSGAKEQIDEGNYEIESNVDINTPGTYMITVKHGDFSQVFEYTVNERIFGDVNFNGKIDASDARLVLRYSAKLEKLDDDALYLADVTNDGKVNVKDARTILRASAKLEIITRTE